MVVTTTDHARTDTRPRPSGRHASAAAVAVAAVTGIVCGAVTLAIGDLVAGFISPQATPVVAVGRAAIDATPGVVKDFAVSAFGTHDKLVLLTGIGVVVTLLSALAGILARRRRTAGVGLAVVLGGIAALAAATRPDAQWPHGLPLDALPALAGTLAGAVALGLLTHRRPAPAIPVPANPPGADQPPAGRRHVLRGLAAVTGGAALAGTGGRVLAARSGGGLSPTTVRLPNPTGPAAPVPSATAVQVAGVTPFITPNRDFYRIDTALVVPRLDAARWRLRVHGLVDHAFDLSYRDLLDAPLIERTVTLTCVSNEVGGALAGTATWLGLPLATVLARAGVHPEADMLLSRSADGFTASTPLSAMLDGRDAMLAVGMNGAPLPAEHGFPARLVVPGLYGFVSATKWVVDLEITRFDRAQAYWTRRGWATHAPIRTASRIDVPRSFARIAAGPTPVAGVAWAQHRGITRVQVSVDGGSWHDARLADVLDTDTWRQWVWTWNATPGMHTLQVRAADATATVQPQTRRPPKPDGATGWHSVAVQVT
jgi:DMSO/TMAO reductase YedYZ molybdopterin-dependent catalytic subunit